MPSDEYWRGYADGHTAGWMEAAMMARADNPGFYAGASGMLPTQGPNVLATPVVSKPKRKVSAYHKRLGREIKRLRRLHLTKAGKWKKGWNQKRLMKTAHKNTK